MGKGPPLFGEGHGHLPPPPPCLPAPALATPIPSHQAYGKGSLLVSNLSDSGTRAPGSHPRLGLLHPDRALPGTQPFPDPEPHPGIPVPSPSSASVLRSVDLNPKCASLITIINRLLNEAANTVNGILLMTLHKENGFYKLSPTLPFGSFALWQTQNVLRIKIMMTTTTTITVITAAANIYRILILSQAVF